MLNLTAFLAKIQSFINARLYLSQGLLLRFDLCNWHLLLSNYTVCLHNLK